jgi:hypothetical protein
MAEDLNQANIEHIFRKGLESELLDLIKRVQRLEAARPPPDQQLLSQEQAATYIGVKPPTLAAWRHYGKGPHYLKVGRSAFYKLADIERWLDAQAVIPIPKTEEAA